MFVDETDCNDACERRVKKPVMVELPLTDKVEVGAVLPMPTLPLLRTVRMFVVVAMVRRAFEADVLVPILRAVVKLEVAVAMNPPVT